MALPTRALKPLLPVSALLLGGLLMAPVLAGTAQAGTVNFSFNSLANNANNTSVQSYMNGILGSGAVTVAGALASNSYTGDGHVVGPGGNALTLGTSDGGVSHGGNGDTFLQNTSSSTEISMTFSTLKIYSISFDYEIFPDGTCPNGTKNCGTNWPDFTFKADGTSMFTTLGVMPGQAGAPYLHSAQSGLSKTELAPQYLGQSGTITFAGGVSVLEFVDWPATIGIDNLIINTTAPLTPVPEPATLALLGGGLLGLGVIRRRASRRA